MSDQQKLEQLKEYLKEDRPLNMLEEFTAAALNGAMASATTPQAAAELATQVAIATLTKLFQIQNL